MIEESRIEYVNKDYNPIEANVLQGGDLEPNHMYGFTIICGLVK